MANKRAVAYARVSTTSASQIHSFQYQNEYWQSYIKSIEDTEFCGIYADA